LAVDVTPILAEYLTGNRGPDPADPEHQRPPNYGIVAALSGDALEVELTFRSGSAYCCLECGCHLALFNGKRWDGLRRRLAVDGVPAPSRLQLRLDCIVEDGALFFDFTRPHPGRHGWYAFAPVAAHRYQATATEAPSPAESAAPADGPRE
jgi:hypothetical protein